MRQVAYVAAACLVAAAAVSGNEARGQDADRRAEQGAPGAPGFGAGSDAVIAVRVLRLMDRDRDGYLEAREISPRARPYVERYARLRQLDVSRPLPLDQLIQAAADYHRSAEPAAGPDRGMPYARRGEPPVPGFGPVEGRPIPGFGAEDGRASSIPVEPVDLKTAADRLRRYDRDRDGHMDRKEARAGRWRDDPFRYDRDHDDRLSQRELAERYAERRIEEARRRAAQQGGEEQSTPRPEEAEAARRREEEERRRREEEERRRRYRSIDRGIWRLAASLLERYDADGSGTLDSAERRAAGIASAAADTDGDRRINRAEMAVWLAGQSSEARHSQAGRLPDWFADRDRNNNGQIEMSEFADEWTEEKAEEFAQLDADRDGILVPEEASGGGRFLGGSYANERFQVIPARSTAYSRIVVDDDEPVSDIDVRLSITHTLDETLDVFLVAPSGERVELFTGVGGSDDHFDNTVLDDEAPRSIREGRPPFAGRYQPEAIAHRQPSLRQFYGKSLEGTWTLMIRAERSERPASLNGWALLVKRGDEGDGSVEDGRSGQEPSGGDARDSEQPPPDRSRYERRPSWRRGFGGRDSG